MLDYSRCPLYHLGSKKQLKYLLRINDNRFLKQEFIATLISSYIIKKGKPRLIEPPQEELKKLQRKIKRLLYKIEYPEYVFSGIPKRSYAQNASYHTEKPIKSMFKIDLRAFFPSISRETVYNFFSKELLCSPDIAKILTNFTTVDIEKTDTNEKEQIHAFLRTKGIKCTNHLISGSPTSQVMSFLVNQNMFNDLKRLSDRNHVVMTIYVDDITFSSEFRISNRFKYRVLDIIKKYHYKISTEKTICYSEHYPKVVTGAVIDSHNRLKIKNNIQHHIITEFKRIKKNPDDIGSINRLKGYLAAARQIDSHAFSGIYRYVYKKQF